MRESRRPFHSLYTHGFVRVAVCVPRTKVADPGANVEEHLRLARDAARSHAVVALFPELGLASYTGEDLFHQDALLEASEAALLRLKEASRELPTVLCVGSPLRHEGKLFNCAVVIHRGRLLGVVPKTFLPNYREFYEKRHFASATMALGRSVELFGDEVPFGTELLFAAAGYPDLTLHVEICEDLWTPIPPSSEAALAGATVLLNLSASNVTIGKVEYRRLLCAAQSGRCVAAYLYAGAGAGESTTDLAWDGHGMVWENGQLLAESERFCQEGQIVRADVDLDRLRQERMRLTSFNDAVARSRPRLERWRRVGFAFEIPPGEIALEREVPRFPYVPADSGARDERCFEAYNIQVHGLVQRLQATGFKKVVLGVSGGLDSTQALIVSAKAMDRMGHPREHILAYTLPGYATSRRTYENAWGLMRALGVAAHEIDIRPSAGQMLRDLDHPFSRGEAVHDVTFENVQAGERTSHLFRLANQHDALVVGTGDLSELALGWATYGVGDHMSHYSVNASVPKTLIQYLIRWVVASGQLDDETNAILESILDTEISPELVPAHGGDGGDGGDGVDGGPRAGVAGADGADGVADVAGAAGVDDVAGADDGQPVQSTEERIGPYELQDFNLYYITRFGYRPSKVAFLSHHAWGERRRGVWPDTLPEERRNEYDLAAVKAWLEVFLERFFTFSQFKRSALPNAPKVGSGGSLSPRGDWRAPSDAQAQAWLDELKHGVP